MNRITDIIRTEVETQMEGTKFHLMDLKYFRSDKSLQISVFIDREDGNLSISDCKFWNRQIQDLIDGKDLIPDNYRLDVSSPGAGRSFNHTWEFRKNLEQNLKVEFSEEEGVIKTLSGTLVDVNEETITLKSDKVLRELSRESIITAVIKLPW